MEQVIQSHRLPENVVVIQALDTARTKLLPEYLTGLKAIIAITNELFPGNVGVELMEDPSSPGFPFVAFTVYSDGDPKSCTAKQLQWHSRVAALSEGAIEWPRLLVLPK